LTEYEYLLILQLDGKIASSRATASVDSLQSKRLSRISAKSAGQLRFRIVFGADRSTPYVLHAFKKKSKQGIKTPQGDIELIKQRLKDAQADYAARTKQEAGK
jgi:Phage-related protein